MTPRYHRSKIGRLAFATRNELNERMRDGATGADCLAWLNAHADMRRVVKETGCGPVNAQNLSDWRQTGYADWLDDQKETERLRRLADLSGAIVSATGGDPSAVGSRLLTARILDAINCDDGTETESLAKAVSALRSQDIAARRTDLAAGKLEQDRQRLALDRQKFQRQTCELFIRWASNRAAQLICADKTRDSRAKVQALGKLMFGDLWNSE